MYFPVLLFRSATLIRVLLIATLTAILAPGRHHQRQTLADDA